MRILIADDDPTAREIARHLIARAGHEVHVVSDGVAALDALLRAEYAIAIVDLQMPGLDGVEVARRARAALAGAPRPRLVAFTAGASGESDRAILDLGFDACLPKPIRPAALAAILGGAVAPPPPAIAPRPLPLPAPAIPALAGVVALLSSAAAPFEALRATACALKGDAVDAERPALAGLCARLEAAAAAHDRASASELAAAIVAMLG